MPQYTMESSRYYNRYDKVDVLSLIDPEWVERSQARKLMQMVNDANREAREELSREAEPVLSL